MRPTTTKKSCSTLTCILYARVIPVSGDRLCINILFIKIIPKLWKSWGNSDMRDLKKTLKTNKHLFNKKLTKFAH